MKSNRLTVPDTLAIAGNNVECIFSGRESRKIRPRLIGYGLPVQIRSFQFYFISYDIRIGETYAVIIK